MRASTKITIIDVLSKYAWALPLKNKNGSDVAAALSKIFRKDERYPRNLQIDQGKEFYNTIVQKKIVKRYNINHYSTYSMMKASVVARFKSTSYRVNCQIIIIINIELLGCGR